MSKGPAPLEYVEHEGKSIELPIVSSSLKRLLHSRSGVHIRDRIRGPTSNKTF